MPTVSVIIPCYNQGEYIDEAVDSVLNQTFQNFEIIIVNDGSTDEFTKRILANYNKPKTRVLHTQNQGLASARNNGIREASGIYILPLDADDRIGDTYLEKAVNILDNNEEVGIVYCEAEFFGGQHGKWELQQYKFPDILLGNCIFCSAFFRKSDWVKSGGYKPVMKYGWEDYEFWISLIELDVEVHQISEILFFYRRKEISMVELMNRENHLYSYETIYKNHMALYSDNIRVLFQRHLLYDDCAITLAQTRNELSQTRNELSIIKHSRIWRWGNKFVYFVRIIFPHNSLRRRLLDTFIK